MLCADGSSGAARVALGTDVPVVFCNDDTVAAKLHDLSGGVFDQVMSRGFEHDHASVRVFGYCGMLEPTFPS